ncbi:hypothetical protein ABIE65_005307 [Constrictibacter sp. MBR-5]|jgi:hypothetical protein|uniref:DUF6522 family protein n=1 Tax=Constrictibacter sp. MBR-5 TaxID=3156467 RepID=UPI0033920F0A
MTAVDRQNGDFVIDAALLADAFGLSQGEIKVRMRDGAITSRCETGVGEDAGCWRLTFHYGDRACRFIIDDAGKVLKKVAFPLRARPRVSAPQDEATGRTIAGWGIGS